MRPRPIVLAVLCLTSLVIILFAPVLFRGKQFGYRDSANYYYPLYLRVQQEWRAGRLPLWMPEANAGTPLLGNPTAAVLYPGKLIYAALPYPWAARVYVIVHVALAFAAMRLLLRHWSVSPTGSTIGAMSYAFGAPVLFQYSNAVLLVGAAWMPLGLRSADRWVRLGNRRALGGMAVVLALQTLGGDPEAAYLVAIAAAGYAVGLAIIRSEGRRTIRPLVGIGIALGLYAALFVSDRLAPVWGSAVAWLAVAGWAIRKVVRARDPDGWEARLLGVGAAGVLALAIGGAQLVPVFEFIARSRRADVRADSGRYEFSVSPTRLIGALWPNVTGTAATAEEWPLALPAWFEETKAWVPSLYLGALTLALAAAGAGLRGGPPWRAWLTGIAVVGSLAALGEHTSPVFWARKLPSGHAEGSSLRNGDGGVYWAIAAAFPGFGSFRYPGKLLVPTCLGLAGLAGLGWDDLADPRRRRRAVAAGIALAGVGFVTLAAVLGCRASISGFLARNTEAATSAYGPLDPSGALAAAIGGIAHGAAGAVLAAGIVAAATRRPALAGGIALPVMPADLAVANARLVVTVPQSVFDAEPRALRLIREAERAQPTPGPFRFYHMKWSPTAWVTHADANRSEEIIAWQRETLGPHHSLPLGLGLVYANSVTELADYIPFFGRGRVAVGPRLARQLGLRPGQQVVYHTRRGFDLWGARYLLLPARLAWNSTLRGYASFLPECDEVYPGPGAFDGPGGRERRQAWFLGEDFQIFRNRAAFPRAWVVHRARFPSDRKDDPGGRRGMLEEILFQNDELWHDENRRVHDPREVAWIEGVDRKEIVSQLSGGYRDPTEGVEVVRDDPVEVELAARLKTPGLVVLADVYYPGWHLLVDDRPAEILRTNGAMRGALVGAGEHRLIYRYDPVSLRVGIGLTIAGIAALLALLAAPGRERPAEGAQLHRRGAHP